MIKLAITKTFTAFMAIVLIFPIILAIIVQTFDAFLRLTCASQIPAWFNEKYYCKIQEISIFVFYAFCLNIFICIFAFFLNKKAKKIQYGLLAIFLVIFLYLSYFFYHVFSPHDLVSSTLLLSKLDQGYNRITLSLDEDLKLSRELVNSFSQIELYDNVWVDGGSREYKCRYKLSDFLYKWLKNNNFGKPSEEQFSGQRELTPPAETTSWCFEKNAPEKNANFDYYGRTSSTSFENSVFVIVDKNDKTVYFYIRVVR